MAGTRFPWQVKFVALALIWGASFLFMKVGLSALHPVQIAAARIVLGAGILLVLLRVTGGRLPRSPRIWGHLAFCSAFLTVLPFLGFVVGEQYVSSALAGIGNATTPLSAVLFGLVLLPSERLTPRKLGAVLVGFVGVVIIAEPWNALGRPDPLGFAIVVLAGSCYGLGWTYNRRFLGDADLGGLSQPAALLLCGSALMVPVVLGWWWSARDAVATPLSLRAATNTPSYPLWAALAGVAVLGLVGTGLAYMLQYDVVRAAGAVVSTTVTYLIPLVSVLLGVVVLGERLGAAQLVGFAIVLGSAYVVNAPQRPAAATAATAATAAVGTTGPPEPVPASPPHPATADARDARHP